MFMTCGNVLESFLPENIISRQALNQIIKDKIKKIYV